MKSEVASVASQLREKAEKLLKSMPNKYGLEFKEAEIIKLLDELEMYSEELEMENEALISESKDEFKFSELAKQLIIHEFEVHQIELKKKNAELQFSRTVQQEIGERYSDLFNFSSTGYLILSKEGEIIDLNHAGAGLLGRKRLSLKNKMFGSFVETDNKPIFEDFLSKIFNENVKATCEVNLIPEDSPLKNVQLTGILTQSKVQCLMTVVDITEIKQAAKYRFLTREILQLLNEPEDIHASIRRALEMLKAGTGVDAVGLRLQKGDEFPYFDLTGFPGEIMQLGEMADLSEKNGKICRDDAGFFQTGCACRKVLSGKNDVSDAFMTPGGSWWTKESYPLSGNSPDQDSGDIPRIACLLRGYQSKAIVPVRSQNKIVGLIHFTDFRKGIFNPAVIEFLEGIASHIGTALVRKQAEETLRKNEELLRTITENAPDIILELNREGTIQYMNRPYEGYEPGECLGKNVLDFIFPEYHQGVNQLLESVFNGRVSDLFEYRMKNAHQQIRWHRAIISPVGESGTIRNAIMSCRDVTETIQNENKLRESEEKRKALVLTSVDGFYVTDIQGRILEVNDAYCRISGYSEKELLHMRIQDLEFEETEEETAAHIQNIIRKGVDRFETHHRCKDGKIISVEAKVQYRAVEGGQFVTFLHDITKLREAEKSLLRSDDRYKSLFQWNYSVILMLNPDTGAIIDANPAACNYYGWTYSELCQKTIFEIDPLPKEDTLSKLRRSMDRENNHLFLQHRLSNGELRDVEIFSGPIRYNDSIMLYTIIHDITGMKRAQEALRKNEEQYSFIYNSTTDIVFSIDMDGRFTSVNRSFNEEIQREPSQIIGHTWTELGLPEIMSSKLEDLQSRVKETNRSMLSEMRLPHPDGKLRYFEFSLNPLHDAAGNVVGIGGSARDITNRKESESALRKLNEELEDRVKERTAELIRSNEIIKEAEEKYRTVSDFAFNWEFWIDSSDRMIYCSPSCVRITGYEAAEFTENPRLMTDIIYPDDLPKYLKHKSTEKEAKVCDHEIHYRILMKDGSLRWMGHFCRPVYDDMGNFKGIRGSNKDITNRKRMLEMLTSSNQKYRLLSENISDGIFICNKGSFEYVNKAMYAIFGYQGHELERVKLMDLLLKDYHMELENFLSTDSEENQSHSFELECQRKDSTPVYVEMLLNYLSNNKLIYGVVHNVTEKKQIQSNMVKTIIKTEEKERSSFSKELHDGLGPLLSTIKLYIRWLDRHTRSKSHKEFIGKASEIVEDALSTVKEISHKLNPLILINFGLEEAISSFVSKLTETSQINIVFESKMKNRTDIEVEATLYRAIIECINNSLKYAHANTIFINLQDSESQLEVRYRDDGRGFDVEKTLKNHKGLGLLNMINRMQTIGGKVELKSMPGRGVDYVFRVKT